MKAQIAICTCSIVQHQPLYPSNNNTMGLAADDARVPGAMDTTRLVGQSFTSSPYLSMLCAGCSMLSGNNLTGTIPNSWKRLTSLTQLYALHSSPRVVFLKLKMSQADSLLGPLFCSYWLGF
jgi:hypothetical protein